MKKKFLALALAFAMLLCAVPSQAYTVREAYADFTAQYPEFVDGILATGVKGVNEALIVDFLRDLQLRLYLINRSTAITEENLEAQLIDAVNVVSSADKYAPLQTALYLAYPDAVKEAFAYARISEEFMPLYETIKTMLFTHNMLDAPDTDDEPYVTELTQVMELNPITVEKGGKLSLPKTVEAASRSGAPVEIDINWTNIPSTAAEGSFTAEGTLDIPEGYALAEGVSGDITVKVTVTKTEGGNTGETGNNTGNGSNTGTVLTDDTTPEKHVYSFSDIDEATELGKAVYALSDIGIINGYLDGTFKAENKITRAEFAKIMVVAMENYSADAKSDFTDVATGDWSYSFVASAKKAGLINGYPDGTFKPQANITRAEVMTVVYRAMNAKKALKTPETFAAAYDDDSTIPEFAKEAVYALTNNGIVSGIKTNNSVGVKFNNILPTQDATRGQCAVMLYNALKAMNKIKGLQK